MHQRNDDTNEKEKESSFPPSFARKKDDDEEQKRFLFLLLLCFGWSRVRTQQTKPLKGTLFSLSAKDVSFRLHFLFPHYFILIRYKYTIIHEKETLMAKRPRKGGSAGGGTGGGPAMRTTNTDSSEYVRKRQAECRGLLEALNFQFYSHVCEQHKNNPRKSWAEGCQDYVKHMKKLMVRS